MPALAQLLLEVVDLAVGPAPLGRAGEPLDPLDQHPAVPGAVEDRDPPVARHIAPEPPEIGPPLLLVGRCRDRIDPVLARVERHGHAADGAALAGGVVPLEDHDQRAVAERLALRLLEQLAPARPPAASGSRPGPARSVRSSDVQHVAAVDIGDGRRLGDGRGGRGHAAVRAWRLPRTARPKARSRYSGSSQGRTIQGAWPVLVRRTISSTSGAGLAVPTGAGPFLERPARAAGPLGQSPSGAASAPSTDSTRRNLSSTTPSLVSISSKRLIAASCALEPRPAGVAGQPVAQGIAVPGAEHHRDLAARRQVAPVAPHPRPGPLGLVRLAIGRRPADGAGRAIPRACGSPRVLPAPSIPVTRITVANGALLHQLELRLEQPGAQLRLGALVLLLGRACARSAPTRTSMAPHPCTSCVSCPVRGGRAPRRRRPDVQRAGRS